MGKELVFTALSVPKYLFKISPHLSNVYQSCCLRQILVLTQESQTLKITWNTDMKAKSKWPPKSASTYNYVWKDYKNQNFSSWIWNYKPGLFQVKYQSSENIGRYPDLYLKQLYLWEASHALFWVLLYAWNEDRCL